MAATSGRSRRVRQMLSAASRVGGSGRTIIRPTPRVASSHVHSIGEWQMSNTIVTVLALIGALAAACSSSPSPVAPGGSAPADSPQSARPPAPSPGVYDLSFRVFVSGDLQEVFSLPVNREVILM